MDSNDYYAHNAVMPVNVRNETREGYCSNHRVLAIGLEAPLDQSFTRAWAYSALHAVGCTEADAGTSPMSTSSATIYSSTRLLLRETAELQRLISRLEYLCHHDRIRCRLSCGDRFNDIPRSMLVLRKPCAVSFRAYSGKA